ncbi:MAG: hypothetical protein ACK55I_29470, partial [bacterium]
MKSTGWQRLVVNEGIFVKYDKARQPSSALGGLILFWSSITYLLYLLLPAKIERAEASWTASATVIAGSAA